MASDQNEGAKASLEKEGHEEEALREAWIEEGARREAWIRDEASREKEARRIRGSVDAEGQRAARAYWEQQRIARDESLKQYEESLKRYEESRRQKLEEILRNRLGRLERQAAALINDPTQGKTDIHIKTLTGKTITLSIWLFRFIIDVKDAIHDKVGIPPDKQRLIFGGKQLEDWSLLADWAIFEENKLNKIFQENASRATIFFAKF